jgi:hypothetical protein
MQMRYPRYRRTEHGIDKRPSPVTGIKGIRSRLARQSGKMGYILLWLIGIPIPLLLVLFLLRGCT